MYEGFDKQFGRIFLGGKARFDNGLGYQTVGNGRDPIPDFRLAFACRPTFPPKSSEKCRCGNFLKASSLPSLRLSGSARASFCVSSTKAPDEEIRAQSR